MSKNEFLKQCIIRFNLEFRDELSKCDHACTKDSVNAYHMEGDIYTHTMMVLRAGLDLYKANTFDDEEYFFKCIVLGCLLHDVGKPFVKTIKEKDDGTIKCYFAGHEHISVSKSITFLMDMIADGMITESMMYCVLYVILHHTEMHKDFKEPNYSDIDLVIYYKVLEYVSKADENGRLYYAEDFEKVVSDV